MPPADPPQKPAHGEAAAEGHPLPRVYAAEERLVVGMMRIFERLLLVLVGLLTLGAAGVEMLTVWQTRTISLADILLLFLYTEVIGMVIVFYTGRGSPFVYPIFIAITALARLIVLQGKDMAPENILFEAAAILLLSISAVIVLRYGKA